MVEELESRTRVRHVLAERLRCGQQMELASVGLDHSCRTECSEDPMESGLGTRWRWRRSDRDRSSCTSG